MGGVLQSTSGTLVGLSIDGPRELHDAFRVDKGGRGTFDSVIRGWRLLQKHGVDVNILCTVHAANGAIHTTSTVSSAKSSGPSSSSSSRSSSA